MTLVKKELLRKDGDYTENLYKHYYKLYLLNLYSKYIMWQANLEELDIGGRMGGRKIYNLRCRWHHPISRK